MEQFPNKKISINNEKYVSFKIIQNTNIWVQIN